MQTIRTLLIGTALRSSRPPCFAQPQFPTVPIPAKLAGKLEHVTVHGKSLEGNLSGDSADREVAVYLPPSYATQSESALSGALSPARLHRHRRELVRPHGPPAFRERAGRRRSRDRGRRARAHRRDAERVHEIPGQHVLELGGHRRLGGVRREGPRRVRRRPLPHAAEAREPRARGPLDGRLRHGAHRDEIPRRCSRASTA